MSKIFVLGNLFFLAISANLFAAPKPKIELMIFATYHLSSPRNDVHNLQADDVLAPKRQQEIVDLVDRIARFKPDKIAIERVADRPGLTSSLFEKFSERDLTVERGEVYQIAFRLAYKLKHKQVYAIDEASESFDYFPLEKVEDFAKKNNQLKTYEAINVWPLVNRKEKLEQLLKQKTLRDFFSELNEPQYGQDEMTNFYYGLLNIADDKAQPAAELNAAWYLRNAKIFSKLLRVAKPGERILVMFGAGHAYWLRHFCSLYPECELVEPNRYIK